MGGQSNWVASGTWTALNFDGTNDYVQLGDFARLSVSNQITVSAWVYPVSLATNRLRIVDSSAPSNWFTIALKTGTNSPFSDVSFFISSSTSAYAETTTVTGVYAVNRWVHLAAAWTAGAASVVYVNGSPASTVAATVVSASHQAGTVLLGASIANALYSNGLQDDTRIYNRVLTPAEIKLLASRRGIGLTPSGSTRATYPTKFQIRIGGTWREADAFTKVAGVWQPAAPNIKVAGVWK
jgi:MSHA biogenesis protein MshQ